VPDLSRSELAAYAACAVLVALLGWRALRADGASTEVASASGGPHVQSAPASARGGTGGGPSSVTVREGGSGSATVYVVGAVRRPGVYRLRMGLRVQDAIRRAGGAGPGADLQAINLAAKLIDAQQVVVPQRPAVGASGAAAVTGGGDGASGGAAVPGETAGAAAPPVNLNSATAEQLDTLDGVGPATAQKILEYRAQHGGFSSIDDLAQIPGIGPKRLETLRQRVVV
jgi:competence protein ComEA